ncbi:MAG: hypothetical protein E7020_01485 [Alphaproteobacteria bacterium]|nr:hypothetical protein [Alphaproteobacteria bacterium]
MTEKAKIFYYSRHKLGVYLLFNLGLLALAILFTWSIFPDYTPVYYFALGTCTLSILSSLFVFLVRMPLAIIDDNGIKIDRNQQLKWSQIKSVERIIFKHFGFERPILKINPQKIANYKMTLMQKIAGNSQFGAFSIPLYAMTDKNAKQIEKLIFSYTNKPKPTPKTTKKTITKKNKTKKTISSPKTKK